MAKKEPVIEVKNLYKIYRIGQNKVRALNGVDMTIYRGEFCSIVGTSGSGKSTMLNMLAGLEKPTKGTIKIAGKHIEKLSENQLVKFRREKVGFIFQSFHLVQELNVEQNIIFPLLLDYKKPDMEQVEEMLEVLGLENRRYHLPGQLSGGQQQRAAIGRALITRPALVLADEPTGNLDSKSSQDVMDLLLRASRHFKQTVLMITHNMNLTTSADRVFRVADGKLEELGGGQA